MKQLLLNVFLFVNSLAFCQEASTRYYTTQLSELFKEKYQALSNDSSQKQGNYELFFRGKKIVDGKYVNNLRAGKWRHFYPNGKLFIDALYVNGLKHGHWKYYYQSGEKYVDAYFKLGNRINTWKSYSKAKKLLAEITYQSENQVFAQQKVFYPNGNLKEELLSFEDSVGNDVKQFFEYFEDGYKKSQIQLVNDTLDGPFKLFHPLGIPWQTVYYDRGRLVEIEQMRAPSGGKLQVGSLSNGTGEARFYDSEGKLYAVEQYKNGLKYGRARYYSDKQLRAEGFYKKGKRIGTWRFYNQNEVLRKERNYYDGAGEIFEINITGNGEERLEGELLNNKRVGVWKEYNFYGELLTEASYLNGRLHGPFVEYLNGKVKAKGGYFFGEKVGQWLYLNPSGKITFTENFLKEVNADTVALAITENDGLAEMKNTYILPPNERAPTFEQYQLNDEDFLNVLIEKLKTESQNEIKGRVVVLYKIDEFGNVKNVEIARSLGYGMDEHILNSLSNFPPYIPKFIEGIPVVTEVTREFNINMNEK